MQLTTNQLAELKKTAFIVRALNHKLRQQIYNYCQKERNVTDIFTHLRLEQSVASQHLAVLRNAGWLKTRREGKQIFYSIKDENISRLDLLSPFVYFPQKPY